jgi:FkbM family methyltransferase
MVFTAPKFANALEVSRATRCAAGQHELHGGAQRLHRCWSGESITACACLLACDCSTHLSALSLMASISGVRVWQNWCNTLQTYLKVPEARGRTSGPWIVFGFEASPRIAPFADRCAQALTASGPLPTPPIPPAGSTRELQRYAPSYNCSMRDLGLRERSEHDRKVYRRQKLVPCMLDALEKPLASLVVDPSLSANATLLHSRLALGRGLCSPRTSRYVLIPAGVGRRDGTLSLNDGPEFMLTGGATHQATSRRKVERYKVAQVDLSAWLKASFTHEDFVVLKLDVEGGEHRIIPKMVADGTLRLVDVFLWECHHMPRSWKSPCHKLLKMLRDNGVRTIYEDPYPWT